MKNSEKLSESVMSQDCGAYILKQKYSGKPKYTILLSNLPILALLCQ